MPLNGEQKRTIEDSISHLLEFSLDPNQFIKEEAELVDAIQTLNSTTSVPIPKTHPFYWLRECLFKPCDHFQNLLKQGPPVTVGEIQQYIVDIIDLSLTKTNHILYTWNKNTVLAEIPQHNWNTNFVPEKAPEDGWDNPWQLPMLENKIYTQELRIQTVTDFVETEAEPLKIVTRKAYVDIIFKASNNNPHQSIPLWEITDHFHNDDEENQYMEKLNRYAARKAKDRAAQVAIQTLSALQMTVPKISRLAKKSNAVKTIVINEFYYQLLAQKSLQLSDIVNLTDLESDNLCHPSLISLVKKNYFTIEEIKKLTQAERKVIIHPLYYDLLEKKLLLLQDIKTITDNHSSFIIHPRITSLIQRHKLTFPQALSLPIYLKDIILSDLYVTFFINNEIDWDSFSNIKRGYHLILLNKKIARWINNGILTFKKMINFIGESIDPQITLFNCYIDIFSIRLYKIINKKPLLIDSKLDDIQTLFNEVKISAQEMECELFIFKECISGEILNFLKIEIENRIENAQKKQFETLEYENILKIISPDAALSNNWSQILSMVIQHCKLIIRINRFKEYPQDESHQGKNSLFYKTCNKRKNNELPRSAKKTKKHDLGDLLNICTSIIELTALEHFDKLLSFTKYSI